MNGGGAEKVAKLLANEFNYRGINIDLVLFRKEGPYLVGIESGINLVILKYNSAFKNLFQLIKYLKKTDSTSIISFMTYVNVVVILASLLSGYSGRLFISERNDIIERHKSNFSIHGYISNILAKILYQIPNQIICISKGVENSLKKFIPLKISTRVIYNPLTIKIVSNSVNKNSNQFTILSIGRLSKQKNFSLLLEAFDLVKKQTEARVKLVILGEGEKRDELELIINKLNLNDDVIMPGFVSNPEEHMLKSDLFVLSSSWEGFGNVIVEALACGLPVISTDCRSGPAEILQNGRIGKLVPIGDKFALADSIVEHIENPNKYSTREERIDRSKDFSKDIIVDQYQSTIII